MVRVNYNRQTSLVFFKRVRKSINTFFFLMFLRMQVFQVFLFFTTHLTYTMFEQSFTLMFGYMQLHFISSFYFLS